MDIQIIETSEKTYANLGRYFYAHMACGKHSALITVAADYIRVIVQNASHKAWRGMGKEYRTAEDAVSAYKTGEIKAMIQSAINMAAA